VVSRGGDHVTAGHSSADDIDEKKTELLEAWSSLSGAVEKRSTLLSDSLAGQEVFIQPAIFSTLCRTLYMHTDSAVDKISTVHDTYPLCILNMLEVI